MTRYHAHSANESGQFHPLHEHLTEVAKLAREFAEPFGGGEAAFYAGLWHDIGKFAPEFQEYLKGRRRKGPDHKGAGTKLACQHLGPAGLIVQGHHGGLKALGGLRGWVAEKGDAKAALQSLETARQTIPNLEPKERVKVPDFVVDRAKAELWNRMVFSAVVDADFLDTERHFNPRKTKTRSDGPDIGQIWERFQARHKDATSGATGTVNQVRSEVHQACLNAATENTGIFQLTVPTGGGKTLSAMAFALKHASIHNLNRVIVATPYTSITQQTASVYREFLDDETGDDSPVVLEHHSMAETPDDDEYDGEAVWQRLAAENWDAPVVVTTTVQLFQSLFSNRTSATRKLHRLSKSVIILDEAQKLPPKLLTPILDVLTELTKNYGSTVVLSTATQPAFQAIRQFKGVPATEIVPGFQKHFQVLKRVNYKWMTDSPMSWEEAADILAKSPQALAVVNTRRDALDLLEAMGDYEALHLSTLLCGKHRQDVVQKIKDCLEAGRNCRVISTQVVEAGVDLDFPMVMRAMGPLDSIIQAAGRCNRSGRLETGWVVVFQPEDRRTPPGDYRTATEQSMSMLAQGDIDLDDPATVTSFFERVFNITETDAHEIQNRRRELNYPEVARLFRMIDDDTVDVIVPQYGDPEERAAVRSGLDDLRRGTPEGRTLLRRLRPFGVQIYRSQVASKERDGLIAQVIPGVYEWLGDYDPVTGTGGVTGLDPDRLIV